ncbi:hypothetical protein QUA86_23905 [Microcoleus sp. F6_B6]
MHSANECPAGGLGHSNAVSLRLALSFNTCYKIDDCRVLQSLKKLSALA